MTPFIDPATGYEVLVIRKPIRRIYLRVREGGSVEVTAPRRVSEREIRDFVAGKTTWLTKYMALVPEKIKFQYVTGEKVFKAGMKRILLWEIEKQLEIWTKRMAIPESRITGVTIRVMKSRWGSCRRVTGRFSFALDLVTKPKECIEAVVVHELCHLFVAGHGPAFYARMETYLPDYKERDRLLSSLPRELI